MALLGPMQSTSAQEVAHKIEDERLSTLVTVDVPSLLQACWAKFLKKWFRGFSKGVPFQLYKNGV